jgi:hypothetical protein
MPMGRVGSITTGPTEAAWPPMSAIAPIATESLWGRDAKCQEVTYAPLFDHFVGTGKQHWRYFEAERLGSHGVDNQLELA